MYIPHAHANPHADADAQGKGVAETGGGGPFFPPLYAIPSISCGGMVTERGKVIHPSRPVVRVRTECALFTWRG
jgi:hypothetical protein